VDAELGQPEETSTDRRGAVNRGNPVIGQSAALTDLSFRATWKLAGQRSQRDKEPGQPGSLSSWLDRWDRRFGETRKFAHRHNRMVQNPGETRGDHQPVPEDLDAGQPEEGSSAIPKDRSSGQPENRYSAPPKDARFEATRNSIAGQAGDTERGATQVPCQRASQEGVRKRGDPRNHRNPRRTRMRNSGQLEGPLPAQPKDEKAGQPAESSHGAAKECEVRGNPETQN